jgi:hypothetical protein
MRSDGSIVEKSVQKLLVVGNKAKPFLVAFTGDGEINGRPTVAILRELGENAEPTAEGFAFILTGLKKQFDEDIANYPWESESDRDSHLREAKLVLHCLTTPQKQHLGVVTPGQITHHVLPPESNSTISGVVKPIEEDLNREFRSWSLPLARQILPDWIATLCKQKECGFPIQMAFWNVASIPKLVELPNKAKVEEFLRSLP